MLVYRMASEVKNRKAEARIKWWKMNKDERSTEFREELRQDLPDECESTAETVKETVNKVSVVPSEQRKEERFGVKKRTQTGLE